MRIIVVDDSEFWKKVIKDLFTDHEVEVAGDGLEGYFRIREFNPDLVISDVVMPGLNGYQLCAIVKNDPELKDIPVILMTTSVDSIDKFWSTYAGANAYIQKDSEDGIELLKEKVKSINGTCREHGTVSNDMGKFALERAIDGLFMRAILENEVRKFFDHVTDINHTVMKLIDFMKKIFEFDDIAFMVLNVEEMDLYTSVDNFKIERYLISKMKKPSFPVNKNFFPVEGSGKIDGKDEKLAILSSGSEEIGIISIWRNKSFSNREIEIFSVIIGEIEKIISIGVNFEIYRRLSTVDKLTGLKNFRSIEDLLINLWKEKKSFYVAMLDIDDFKKVNDTYGHEIGNEVLAGIGKVILELSESFSVFSGRFGGEEFIIVSPERENFFFFVDLVREKIGSSRFSKSFPDLKVTISGGIASSEGANSYTQVIEWADKSLYKAKQSGKNRVKMTVE